jgi:hypothetical protein
VIARGPPEEQTLSDVAVRPGPESPPPSLGGAVDEEPAFERRGIDYIPYAERRGRPIDLALMWAGALFNVEYVVYGALIMSFGLRFWQAALVIVVGNLSYLIAGLGSLQGPKAGTAAFTINRAPFGPNGAKLIAAFNWMTQVGYEVEGLAHECQRLLAVPAVGRQPTPDRRRRRDRGLRRCRRSFRRSSAGSA